MSTNCYCNIKTKEDPIRWIVQQLGPVLLGVKPSEVLSFPKNRKDKNTLIHSIGELFKFCSKVDYIVFYTPNGCMKIFFYNTQSLENTLKERRNLKFLKKIGYPESYELETYLNIMISKFDTGQMPHEIGTFLGYPLKDVIGFMGHPSLKLTKVNGWRIYGNPKVSDLKCQQILEAKEKIKQNLLTRDIHSVLEVAL